MQTADTPETTHDNEPRPRTNRSNRDGVRKNSDQGLQGQRNCLQQAQGSGGCEVPRASAAAGAFLGELARLLSAEIGSSLADQLAELASVSRSPKLLDRRGLATALDVSLPTVDRLTRDGIPHLRIGDSPRYELDRVLSHLRGDQ